MALTPPSKSRRARRRLKLAWVSGEYFILGQKAKIGPFNSVNVALTFHRRNKRRAPTQGLVSFLFSVLM